MTTNLKDQRQVAVKAAQDIVDGAKAESRDLHAGEVSRVRDHLKVAEDLTEKIKAADERQSLMDQISELVPGEAVRAAAAGQSKSGLIPETQLKAMFQQARSGSPARVEVDGRKAFVGTPTAPIVAPGLTGGVYVTQNGLADLFPHRPIDGAVQRIYRTTTAASVAGVTAEGGAKPDAGLVVGYMDATVSKIAAIQKVSEELLSDYPSFQQEIGREVAQAVKVRENAVFAAQILATSGIQTSTPSAGVNVIDAVADGAATMIANGITPTAVAVSPADWAKIRKAKAATAGSYLLDPTGTTPTLFTMPMVVTASLALNTVLLLDAEGAGFVGVRDPLTIDLGYDADDWSKNLRTLRVEERLLLAVTTPSKIMKITLS